MIWFCYWACCMAWLYSTLKIFEWAIEKSISTWFMVWLGWLSLSALSLVMLLSPQARK